MNNWSCKNNLNYINISDYKTPDFNVPYIYLNFIIQKDFVSKCPDIFFFIK